MRTIAILCLSLSLFSQARPVTANPPVAVAGASDLAFVLREVISAWRDPAANRVRISLGSSGNFFRQIVNGAPFDLFLSASDLYVDKLPRERVCDRFTYAWGRIVLFAPSGSGIDPGNSLVSLAARFAQQPRWKFAIANPDHAPYGLAARQALANAGVWRAIQPHLVLGENASQASRYAVSGTAAAGLIPLSIASSRQFLGKGRFRTIDASAHAPLRQEAALLSCDNPNAQRLFSFLRTRIARTIFSKYGFRLPERQH